MTSRSPSARPGSGAAAPGRCAQCGARLSPADHWCGLCHTPVRSQRIDPVPIELSPVVPGLVVADPIKPSSSVAGPGSTESIPASAGDSDHAAVGELTPERLDHLLARLAAAETSSDPRIHLGALAGLQGRAGGLLLASVLGLVLLAGGMLSLYVLGSLI